MSNILVLSQTDVETLLSRTNAQVCNQIVDLMEETFQKYTASHSNTDIASKVQSPQRVGVKSSFHHVLFMPSRLEETTSIKIVSVPTKDGKGGLASTILVLNEETGITEAIINADALTAVRTAAGSALATRHLAKSNAKNLVIFGAGAQARSHVDMMIAVRPTIKKIAIWNRSGERRDKLIEELKLAYPDREFIPTDQDLQSQVEQADIICTCTNATKPVLFGKWLKPGVHLNCVGSYTPDMHEIDPEAVNTIERIVVDSVEACSHEAGELIKSSRPEDWLEIGQLTQEVDANEKNKITLFKSVGISLQDSAIAGFMVNLAKEKKMGTRVPF
ncbi:unnamed protein product [Rhizopus microsporus]|uniref:NAD(P)-binding protein n=2 Tax=Rhizopus TaxID=4842 RepID=A0A1X0S915_RHIZD|nr:hypothetical protein G6F69_000131 [Rhizopus microsporus]KAG1238374.1 hypothetical protein G6F67_000461 [Rhizopus microsporus]KAG1269013.1 hypothetical protein G6F68_000648 [Rhizopus microsporus]ORE20754.1 NAD(P)-binding protein [Rhizopus microsporus]